MSPHPNHLAQQTSPYLQQHAGNPVDWYPWGEAALRRAREEDKPILLSIGYSACHWCHVMAHESFQDEDTARVMNALFVNVKVDREERPDLDRIYQTAQALLTQRSGGWPLTLFLTPGDQTPFFGGTYFPKRPMHGLPAFRDLLQRVEAYFRQHRDEIESQNDRLRSALASIYVGEAGGALDPGLPGRAREALAGAFDARRGGFGAAPKFPHPTDIELLLRRWAADPRQDPEALHMARFTLERMAEGGIFDHLGGGFCRYSVDEDWMIPHFEKMLYDNGALLALYSEAAAATGSELFRRTALETAQWVMREMQSHQGGYYSSLDADSEGQEGRFYVWARDELKALLDDQDYEVFARRFGLHRGPNFEGRWHLHGVVGIRQIARELGLTEQDVQARIGRARQTLFQFREQRVRPGRDEKILTSWNALMIKGMAAAARHLDRPELADSATRALDFIARTLWRDGRLLATYKDRWAHLNAYVDDYAFLVDALLELLQVRWRAQDLEFARALSDTLLERFEDRVHGGLYFTSDDHEALIQRPKVYADEATPAGNSVAALALTRLGHLLGETRFIEAAERILASGAKAMGEAPHAHAMALMAYEEQLDPPQIVILRGQAPALDEWHRRCVQGYAPRRLSLAIAAGSGPLAPALAEKAPRGEIVAYVCEGMSCSAPIRDRDALSECLQKTEAHA
jgi:uncharacterized protein YyaL (SSP411 family)